MTCFCGIEQVNDVRSQSSINHAHLMLFSPEIASECSWNVVVSFSRKRSYFIRSGRKFPPYQTKSFIADTVFCMQNDTGTSERFHIHRS